MASEERNALAKLAEELGHIGAMNAVLKARRIIAELAKIQDEEAALLSMKHLNSDEARRIARQRKENCILKCRAIAEEGAEDGK